MKNLIILLALGLILGAAIGYLWNSKKAGKNCIGCPNADSCPHRH